MSEQVQTRAEMIRDLLASGMHREEVLRRVVPALSDDEIDRIVRKAINLEISHLVRQDAEAAMGRHDRADRITDERAADRESFITHAYGFYADDTDPGDRLSRRAEILEASFTVPETGEIVKWGDATTAQHVAQKERCEKIGHKVFQTAHLHARAINEILAAGVSTLNDIVEMRHANEKALAAPKKSKAAA